MSTTLIEIRRAKPADAVAVVSAVFDAPDVERAARRIAALFAEHGES